MRRNRAAFFTLGCIVTSWGFQTIDAKADDRSSGVPLSTDALRKCAQAKVAECQFRYGQALEQGVGVASNRDAARQQYELAYQGGIEDAGAALLRLTRQGSQSTLSPLSPTPSLTPVLRGAPTAPEIDRREVRRSDAATKVSIPVTATRRNPGELVGVPSLTESEYAHYSACWKIVFTHAFVPSKLRQANNPKNYNRITGKLKDNLFSPLERPEVRVVCLKPEGGAGALIEGGRAVPLRYGLDEKRNVHFGEEYQTSPTQTTNVSITIDANGRDASMFLAAYPLSKGARVSRSEPESAKWFKGDATPFSP